jgi:hypothetical protein
MVYRNQIRRPMSRRVTKRWACHHCASLLRSFLESGWPFNYEDGEEEWSPEDETRIGEAIQDIISELYRRGLKDGDVLWAQ